MWAEVANRAGMTSRVGRVELPGTRESQSASTMQLCMLNGTISRIPWIDATGADIADRGAIIPDGCGFVKTSDRDLRRSAERRRASAAQSPTE